MYYTVVDYTTGKCLEADNDKNVTVINSDWKYSKTEKKTGVKGSWISYPRKSTVKVTITYPENYKDLTIGVGGYTSYNNKASAFWAGKKSYSKEKKFFTKKDKGYAHFMRVK